ncbi:MAG: O-antigen ligase family protein, partial [Bacteroidota bacterium]
SCHTLMISYWLTRIDFKLLGVLAFTLLYGLAIAKKGIMLAALWFVFPFLAIFLIVMFREPRTGVYIAVIMSFAANALSRYVPSIPFGLSLDGILVFTYVAILLQPKKIPWKEANNPLTWLALIWFMYNVFELVNPEARSRVAWFYAMRGVAFYKLLLIPLILVMLNKRKHLDTFLHIWFILSLLASLKGIQQKHLGVDPFEQRWLDAGAAVQHILFGKLRVFSIYSDAGQCGAAQAHTFVTATVIALGNIPLKKKIFYGIVGLLGAYGMMISGTRGALAIPALGFFTYFVLSKNFKIVTLGLITGFLAFGFLKFTTIGQNVYMINRMRTALNPNDPSLLVRLENQRKLRGYLASRPFGGGVGSAGNWGLRFSPNTFLAQTPTDSWYVRIWAEYGVVGLYLHLFVLFSIAGVTGYYIWNMQDPILRQKMMGMHGGMMGIYLASYGNGVLGQMPTGIIIYCSMAFMFLIPKLDKSYQNPKEEGASLREI